MKKISIKTVDGSRFDYIDKDNLIQDAMTLLNKWPVNAFYGFPVEGGYKFFNQRNIVSVTETEIGDA